MKSLLLLSLLFLVLSLEAFVAPSRPRARTKLSSTLGDEDFPEPDETASSVDWDAEWKKVMEKERVGIKKERPGKDFYKNEAQIAAIRTANKATGKLNEAAEDFNVSLPTWRSLKGDWKFWISALALISVGSSLIAAGGSEVYSSAGGGHESYYI